MENETFNQRKYINEWKKANKVRKLIEITKEEAELLKTIQDKKRVTAIAVFRKGLEAYKKELED